MRKDIDEYYHALGLNPGAGPIEIKRAYRQLIRRWHPDLFKPGSPMQTTAEHITKEINEAYDKLFRKKLYRKYLSKAERSADKAGEADEPEAKPSDPAPEEEPAKKKQEGRSWWKRPNSGGAQATGKPRWPGVARHARKAFVGGLALAALGLGYQAVRGLTDMLSQPAPPVPVAASPRQTASREPDSGSKPAPAPNAAAAAPRQVDPPSADPLDRLSGHSRSEIASRSDFGGMGSAHPSDGEAFQSGFASAASEAPAAAAAQGPGSTQYVPSASAGSPAESLRIDQQILRAQRLLDTFDYGDSKERVREVQGVPDEEGERVLRYGSSLVFFRHGYVTGWVDRLPALSVRKLPTLEPVRLDWFHLGSSRQDVVLAQGSPLLFTPFTYSFGTSTVSFDRGVVSSWSEGDVPLRTMDLPVLSFDNPAR
jgi:curved DNA-binding protein CbpA